MCPLVRRCTTLGRKFAGSGLSISLTDPKSGYSLGIDEVTGEEVGRSTLWPEIGLPEADADSLFDRIMASVRYVPVHEE